MLLRLGRRGHPEAGALAGEVGDGVVDAVHGVAAVRVHRRRASGAAVERKSGTTTTPARPRTASARAVTGTGVSGTTDLRLHRGGEVVLEHAGLAGDEQRVALGVEAAWGCGVAPLARRGRRGGLGDGTAADDRDPLAVERARARRGRRPPRSRRPRSGRRPAARSSARGRPARSSAVMPTPGPGQPAAALHQRRHLLEEGGQGRVAVVRLGVDPAEPPPTGGRSAAMRRWSTGRAARRRPAAPSAPAARRRRPARRRGRRR